MSEESLVLNASFTRCTHGRELRGVHAQAVGAAWRLVGRYKCATCQTVVLTQVDERPLKVIVGVHNFSPQVIVPPADPVP